MKLDKLHEIWEQEREDGWAERVYCSEPGLLKRCKNPNFKFETFYIISHLMFIKISVNSKKKLKNKARK